MVDNLIMSSQFPKNILCGDSDISELKNRPEGTITENELKEVLRRYNLRDGLILLGRVSVRAFNDKSENAIGKASVRDPATGIFITQFALAYLANTLITSGANDYKSKQISNKENLLILLNIYSNCLIFSEIKRNEAETVTKKDVASTMIRLYGEQLEYQFDFMQFVSRTLVIFMDIIDTVPPGRFEPLNAIFERETGLTFRDYFILVLGVWAVSQQTGTFRKEALTEAQIPSMCSIFTDEKVSNLLKILSIDYKRFREEDELANENLEPVFTKTRFNPLIVYPIIKTDSSSGDPYVIPNTLAFLKKGYGGLYWWFHRYFENNGKQQDFRNYFGEVFEQYVGRILKNTYGENEVHPEISYPKGKFIDWWVERNKTIYIFEVKAYQFSLPTKQTGDIELVAKEVKSKIVKSIKQVYKRLSEIDSYEELAIFRNKKIVPVVVFMEIPLVSGHIYKELIEEELCAIEQEDKNMMGITGAKIHFVNIEELEYYADAVDKIPIEEVFAKYEDDIKEGFISILYKELGRSPKNEYLSKVYNDFWREVTSRTSDGEPTERTG